MDAARTSVPAAGTLVNGRYRVGTPLGEGGMGVVLAARDEETHRDVALKLLSVVGEQNIERFLREARLSMKIDSPHVVRVLDVGQIGSLPFFVMERLEGEDFGAKVREGALPLAKVADCVVQTCEALAHAHGAGIVHRDIKASNLFEHRGGDGKPIVKVLDFGISKIFTTNPLEVERTLTRTRDGGFLGSPPYMSPEHVKDPRNVDGRSDLWSLGVVAYRLLSTQFPFAGESTGEVLAAILEGKPKRLREHGIEVPPQIESIILERLLARDREDRCPDAGAVARAFAPFATHAFQTYGERVTEIVNRGVVPSPIERSSKRRAVEPRTATVPPPIAEEPATLALDAPPDVLVPIAIEPVTPVPNPLEILPVVQLPEVVQPPKSRVGLWVGVLVVLAAAAGGAFAVSFKARAPGPAATTAPVFAPSTPSIPSALSAPSASSAPTAVEPAAATAPATSVVEVAAPAPAETHSAKASGRKPPPRPAPRPSPAPAKPTPKGELEKNPYAQ